MSGTGDGRAGALTAELVRLLADGAGHRAVEACLARLDERLGGQHALWLADYQHVSLQQVAPASSSREQVEGSWVGRCFAAQSTLHDGAGRAGVPVSARGDRIGVLERAGETDGDVLDVLQVVASVLGLALTSRSLGTDRYERLRRQRPLTLAAEMQWGLLHGRAYRDEAVSIGATLEPAYSVAGDAFDWSRQEDTLAVAVLDGSGRGVPAALSTTLALTALRNARASGLDLADQAALADQALYAHHGGEAFVSGLLLELHLRSGALSVIDAGSPQLLRVRGTDIEVVELDHQLPLGMFEESVYEKQLVQLEPGDRLVVVSDGVHASAAGDQGSFGDRLLAQALRDASLLPPNELTRHVVRTLQGTLPGEANGQLSDDAVVLCLDWPGAA